MDFDKKRQEVGQKGWADITTQLRKGMIKVQKRTEQKRRSNYIKWWRGVNSFGNKS